MISHLESSLKINSGLHIKISFNSLSYIVSLVLPLPICIF